MITFSLCVELDVSDPKAPVVKDVTVRQFNGHPPFRPIGNHGPFAVLSEVTTTSPGEARNAMRGIIENTYALSWVRDWPHIRQFLCGPWMG